MPEYLVNIRWEPSKVHTTTVPYVPRIGDVLEIYSDDYENEIQLVNGEVYKVVFFRNPDTVHASEPEFDIYIK